MTVRRSASSLAAFAALATTITLSVPASARAPAGRYTVTSATVFDTATRLTWQRTITVNPYTFNGAATYCASLGAGWRVPSTNELLTLVDYSVARIVGTAQIDIVAFPATPDVLFWTSTPFVALSGSAWSVDFAMGALYSSAQTDTLRVRCVH